MRVVVCFAESRHKNLVHYNGLSVFFLIPGDL